MVQTSKGAKAKLDRQVMAESSLKIESQPETYTVREPNSILTAVWVVRRWVGWVVGWLGDRFLGNTLGCSCPFLV